MICLIGLRLAESLLYVERDAPAQSLGIRLSVVFLKLVRVNHGLGSPQADLIANMLGVQSTASESAKSASGRTHFVHL